MHRGVLQSVRIAGSLHVSVAAFGVHTKPQIHNPVCLLPLAFRPYIKDAQRIMTQARDCGNTRILISKLNFLHLPIIDGSITTDSAISKLADDCCGRVLAGEKLYIHCWGGHGRTGTLVSFPAPCRILLPSRPCVLLIFDDPQNPSLLLSKP